MFDPTVFENLKVAIENTVYDLDNLDRAVTVTGRTDLLDLAVMSRSFTLRFELSPSSSAAAEICLEASLKELAAEILETPGGHPGCTLTLRFHLNVTEPEQQCSKISAMIQDIWKPDTKPVQALSYTYGEQPVIYRSTVSLHFPHQINEDHIRDIPALADYMMQTLRELEEV